jgi:ATP-dependent DNA helicase RecQ
LSPEAAGRFQRLRAVRTQLAREKALPPYCICNDRTLKLIAHVAPADLESMEHVKGMGPHKVKNYGALFLEAMKDLGPNGQKAEPRVVEDECPF